MSRRRALLVMASVALVVGGAACESDQGGSSFAPSGSLPPFDSVVMIGDSITEGSKAALEEAFAANGYTDIRIEGLGGRRIDAGAFNGVSVLDGVLAEGADPDLWVIELGTNDLGKYTQDEYEALIDEMLDTLPDGAPVVWVNTFWRQRQEDSREFNTTLGQMINDRDDATVADWYTFVASPDQDLLVGDGVHPNDDGTRALALIVFEAISRL